MAWRIGGLLSMLMKNEAQLIRVLENRDGKLLMINCKQRSMPVWVDEKKLDGYVPCAEEELCGSIPQYEGLSPQQQRFAHERYTLVAGVIPFLGDKQLRCEAISRIAEARDISRQTIRHYLHRYLVYQSIAALAPPPKRQRDELTPDEKNMRWALNKFYYTRQKNSLSTAYAQMLRHRYCNENGVLLDRYPTIHQFRYFFRKHRKLQTCYISRDGLKHYQRNNRPLLGDGIQEFAPSIGTGMLDSNFLLFHGSFLRLPSSHG